MAFRQVRNVLLVLAVVAVAGWVGAARTSWAETKGAVGPFESENNTGVLVTGLRVTFAGGALTQASATRPAGCNQATVSISNGGTVVTIDFGAKCMRPLAKVVVTGMTKVRPLNQVRPREKIWLNGTSTVEGKLDVRIGPKGKDAAGYPDSCPPYKPDRTLPPKNAEDIDGDGEKDWLIEIRQIKVTDADGSSRTLTVFVWCLDHRPLGDWSFSVGKSSVGPNSIGGMLYSPAPSSKAPRPVPNAPNSACPFDHGNNRGSPFFGPKGPDGLPTTVDWYSKAPAAGRYKDPKTGMLVDVPANTLQRTTRDVRFGAFTQNFVKPTDPGYRTPPPGVAQAVWDNYLDKDPNPACSVDDDSDGLNNGEEMLRGTEATSSDSDTDGFSDDLEVRLGSDPLNPNSKPEDLSLPGTCSDGIDNDFDGLTDSADPGCVDTDADGIPDSRDNCATVPNPDQADVNGNGIGAACDPDDDSDGVADASDSCLGTPLGEGVDASGCGVDPDFDGVCAPGTLGTLCSGSDNCPTTFNADQSDFNRNGIGDACDAVLGGVAAYPDLSSGSNAGLLAGASTGALAALLLSGAAWWYARRRWVR